MAPLARLFLLLVSVSAISAFLLSDNSCRGRCHKYIPGSSCFCNDGCVRFHDCCPDYNDVCGGCAGHCNIAYDSSRSCQCNSDCNHYGNCCNDYNKACHQVHVTAGPHGNPSKIADELWSIDVHRPEADELSLHFGSQTLAGSSADKAPAKLFTKVDENRFSHPTYKTFIALLDSFRKGGSTVDQSLVDAFLDAVFTSEVTRTAHAYLVENKYTTGSLADYRATLKSVWFTPSTTGGVETTGFCRLVLGGGGTGGGGQSGPHTWFSVYLGEKAGRLDYLGYLKKNQIAAEVSLSSNSSPVTSSFILGSSPVFDLNLVTLCVLSGQSPCTYTASGSDFTITVSSQGQRLTDLNLSL